MKTTNKHCEYCNIEFIAKRFDAKFCSGACKQNAYLDRLRNFDAEEKNRKFDSTKSNSRKDKSTGATIDGGAKKERSSITTRTRRAIKLYE